MAKASATQIELTKSRDYSRRAREVVPCATNTLSRGPDNWVQGVSPSFIQRGQGAHVFDVDGNKYIDYAAGLGPTILGYGHPVVIEAVKRQLEDGSVFAMCHPLEVELSELLCEVIPCGEMVRLGRNGSDVTSAAVRLARAYTGRDMVACCGYHGFQDWYIGSTERNAGIPQVVRDLTKPFPYNDIAALRRLLAEHEGKVACVIMEPVYAIEPLPGFLEAVEQMTHQAGSVLIFDEVFTGFRWALGGAQEYFGITPDLACFSKAMANGMPISALVGKREVMRAFDTKQVFYSCTFSGEATGMAAAMACIHYIRENNVVERIWNTGTQIIDRFRELAKRLGISYISITGYPPKSAVLFEATGGFDFLEIKSLFQQECIRRGVLWIGYHLPGLAHTQEIIDETFEVYEQVFPLVDKAVQNRTVLEQLEGPVIRPIFANVGDRSGGPTLKVTKD
jgi:glutamate-1-semialdehyde 2,1-aminomutase/spore coat polysaccharide biosynthesis protein SpsF